MYKHMEIHLNKNYKRRTGGHKASIRKHHAWFLGAQSGNKGRMVYTATIYIYIYTFVSLWCGPLAWRKGCPRRSHPWSVQGRWWPLCQAQPGCKCLLKAPARATRVQDSWAWLRQEHWLILHIYIYIYYRLWIPYAHAATAQDPRSPAHPWGHAATFSNLMFNGCFVSTLHGFSSFLGNC